MRVGTTVFHNSRSTVLDDIGRIAAQWHRIQMLRQMRIPGATDAAAFEVESAGVDVSSGIARATGLTLTATFGAYAIICAF